VWLELEVARQVWSPHFCEPVSGVLREYEGQRELSKLVTSVCELSLDICIFGADLHPASGTYPDSRFEL